MLGIVAQEEGEKQGGKEEKEIKMKETAVARDKKQAI
jgi:hypothetical protein